MRPVSTTVRRRALVAAESVAEELGLPVAMRLVSHAFAGETGGSGVGPRSATEKALDKAGLSIEDIGAFEINEAFAVQVLAFLDHFGIDASDPRVTCMAAHRFRTSPCQLRRSADDPVGAQSPRSSEACYGITTMCIGLGMGGSVIWENPHFVPEAAA